MIKRKFDTLLYRLEDGILIITINRPDKLNALNAAVFTELDVAMDEVSENSNIRSVIITGSGQKAFVAGADITEFGGLDHSAAMDLSKRGQDVFFKIEKSSKPVVAAVNGFALGGGCELSMACHFRTASHNARFGQPEVNLGLIPGYGGTQRLTQLIGKGRALELLMSAGMIDAETALRYGLVNHVFEQEQLINKTKELLLSINSKAPLAVAGCIEAVNICIEGKENGFDKEVEIFGRCFTTEDMKEGTAAFLEKRKATFTGK